jgi:hypothetical protein
MRRLKKLIIVQTIVFALAFSLSFTAFAHNTSLAGVVEGEEGVGWIIHEPAHNGDSIVRYTFLRECGTVDPNLTPTHRAATQEGAARWAAPYQVLRVDREPGFGVGYIRTFSRPRDSEGRIILAQVHSQLPKSDNGHFISSNTSWWIQINIHSHAGVLSATTMAHEFGHAFGLLDLYNSNNMNKLMFGTSNSTATRPSAADLRGASVITGRHGSTSDPHRFDTAIFDGNPNTHRLSCTTCHGFRIQRQAHSHANWYATSSTQCQSFCRCGTRLGNPVNHTFSNNVCTKCNFRR